MKIDGRSKRAGLGSVPVLSALCDACSTFTEKAGSDREKPMTMAAGDNIIEAIMDYLETRRCENFANNSLSLSEACHADAGTM